MELCFPLTAETALPHLPFVPVAGSSLLLRQSVCLSVCLSVCSSCSFGLFHLTPKAPSTDPLVGPSSALEEQGRPGLCGTHSCWSCLHPSVSQASNHFPYHEVASCYHCLFQSVAARRPSQTPMLPSSALDMCSGQFYPQPTLKQADDSQMGICSPEPTCFSSVDPAGSWTSIYLGVLQIRQA